MGKPFQMDMAYKKSEEYKSLVAGLLSEYPNMAEHFVDVAIIAYKTLTLKQLHQLEKNNPKPPSRITKPDDSVISNDVSCPSEEEQVGSGLPHPSD
jgi:hypothetical protein